MMLRSTITFKVVVAFLFLAGTTFAARASLGPNVGAKEKPTHLTAKKHQHEPHMRALQQAAADSFMRRGDEATSSSDSRRGRGTSHSDKPGTSSSAGAPGTTPASSTVPADAMDSAGATAGQPVSRQPASAQYPITVQQTVPLPQRNGRPGASRQQPTTGQPVAAQQPAPTQQRQQQLAGRQQLVQQPAAQQPAGRQQPLPMPVVMPQPVYAQQPVMVQQPGVLQQPLFAQPGYAQLPMYAQQPAFDYTQQRAGRQRPNAGAMLPSQPQIVYVPVPIAAPVAEPVADTTPAKPEKLTRQERNLGNLDFGLIPKLNLSSGLEDLQSGLSDLVREFQGNGGFWNGKTLGENVVNAVQLGVKGGLKLAAPIVNGIASSVPIMVPAMNGKCINGKPVHPMKDNKRMVMCLVGTGAQVTDYITNAADLLAGMAGQVLIDNPQAAAAAGARQAAAAAAEQARQGAVDETSVPVAPQEASAEPAEQAGVPVTGALAGANGITPALAAAAPAASPSAPPATPAAAT